MDAFRHLLYENITLSDGEYTNVSMVDNFRPLQPLNSRLVMRNFEDLLPACEQSTTIEQVTKPVDSSAHGISIFCAPTLLMLVLSYAANFE